MMLHRVIFGVFISVSVAYAVEPSDRLIAAMIQVESNGNDNAVGDTELSQPAYGCLQIRQPACDDVNRRHKTAYQATYCLGNRALSIEICKKYLAMWATEKRIGRRVTDEDLARIWNGGPNGYKKESTVKYWEKIQAVLNKQTKGS